MPESFTINVNSANAASALVDLEVYDAKGNKVFQQWWDNQTFVAGQTRTFKTTWTLPRTLPVGTYRLKIGVFKTGWGLLYNWNNGAAQFSVN